MKDPELYLERLEIEVRDYLAPELDAVLDAEHRVSVNFETYLFATPESRQAFLLAPLEHLGRLTDPVTLARFSPGPDSPRIDVESRTYYFATDESRDAFAAEPLVYAVPKRHMRGRSKALKDARKVAALQTGG